MYVISISWTDRGRRTIVPHTNQYWPVHRTLMRGRSGLSLGAFSWSCDAALIELVLCGITTLASPQAQRDHCP